VETSVGAIALLTWWMVGLVGCCLVGQRPTTNDERRTTNDERRTTNDERPNDRTTERPNDERPNDRTTNDDRTTKSVSEAKLYCRLYCCVWLLVRVTTCVCVCVCVCVRACVFAFHVSSVCLAGRFVVTSCQVSMSRARSRRAPGRDTAPVRVCVQDCVEMFSVSE